MSAVKEFRLETITKGFSEYQLRVVFRNMGALELTSGCSTGCDFCGFGAEKGVSTQMPFSDIENMLLLFGKELHESRAFTYWATDPLDWTEGNKDYQDVVGAFESIAGYKPFISTTAPRGKEELALELLLSGKLERISVSHMNFSRLKSFFNKKYPQLQDHSFSVIQEDDTTRRVIFTDHPNTFGDQAWIELVLALEKKSSDNGRTYIFSKDGTKKGEEFRKVGLKHIDALDKYSIGCFHGTLLRSTGLYNSRVVPVSKEHPYGVTNIPISPNSFQPYHLWANLFTPFYGIPKGRFNDALHQVAPNQEAIAPFKAQDIPKNCNYKPFQFLLIPQSIILSAYEEANYEIKQLIQSDLHTAVTSAELILSVFERNYKTEIEQGKSDNPYFARYQAMKQKIADGKAKIYHYLPEYRKAEIAQR